MSRLVFLAPPQLDPFQDAVVARVLAARRDDVAGVAIDARSPEPLRARLAKHVRRGRGGYVAVMALGALRRRRRPARPAARVFAAAGARVIEARDPYAPSTLAEIAALQPDVLLLVGGFGIVKEPLLDLAPAGVLSYHHGDMRRYRGQPPAFWELCHGERSMVVTVQRLAAGIDCGTPIVERRFEIRPDDSLATVSRRIYDGSVDMMLAAVERVERGEAAAPVETLGDVYTLPNLRQWLVCRARVAARIALARARSLRG